MEKYEIKDGNRIVTVEVLEIEGIVHYSFKAEYFETVEQAEENGYYWNDEVERWVKEITDNTTTVF